MFLFNFFKSFLKNKTAPISTAPAAAPTKTHRKKHKPKINKWNRKHDRMNNWNDKHSVGEIVFYIQPDGTKIKTKTTSYAWMVNKRTLINLRGLGECTLSRVRLNRKPLSETTLI